MNETETKTKELPTLSLGDRVHVEPAAALSKPYDGKVVRLLLPSGTPLTTISAHIAPHSIVRVQTHEGREKDALWGVDHITQIPS